MQLASGATQGSSESKRPSWAGVGLGILAALLGAVAMFLALGAIVVAVLFYGNRLGTVNLNDGPVASGLLVAFFVSPIVGAVAGVWVIRRSDRRRSRSSRGRSRGPYPPA